MFYRNHCYRVKKIKFSMKKAAVPKPDEAKGEVRSVHIDALVDSGAPALLKHCLEITWVSGLQIVSPTVWRPCWTKLCKWTML